MSKQSDTTQPENDVLISVIIPTYKRSERLQHLLKQLISQDVCRSDYEIIVVDDGSPEPVCPDVSDIGRDAGVAVHCFRKENGGPAAARNFGARLATGEFLLFVDDDMSVRPDFIRAHIETQKEFGPALVNCQFDWQVEAASKPFQLWYKNRVEQWSGFRLADAREIADDVFEITNVLATTANLSVSRRLFESVEGFDEGYPFGCEDQDFAGRLGRSSVRALATRRSVATHVETHNSLRRLCERQRLGAMDTVRFIRRFAVEHHCGEQEIATTNGPIRVGTDSRGLILRKMIRQLIAAPFLNTPVFAGVRLLELVSPDSTLLPKAYDAIVSAYAQKGWREGLRVYEAEPPLKEWAPAGTK